tara:strand:- start:45 stop:491 length:447 start_codon:yes stop_codon:yes gene_type:complete
MSSLPFELYKYHKRRTKESWNRIGIKIDPDDFDYVYNKYIHATNCELCNKLFSKLRDRQLDHDHETGEVRNIVCNKCNCCKKDKKSKQNNTGEDYISKSKSKEYTNGYSFRIRIMRDGNYILNTQRNTLEKAIKCRDEFIANHPEIFS